MVLNTNTFVVGIFHNHNGELTGVHLGKLQAKDENDATKKSETWVKNKKTKHSCENDQNDCTVTIRKPTTGNKGFQLLFSAEEIILDEA